MNREGLRAVEDEVVDSIIVIDGATSGRMSVNDAVQANSKY